MDTVKQATSLFCRLGFAKIKNAFAEFKLDESWLQQQADGGEDAAAYNYGQQQESQKLPLGFEFRA